MHAALYAVLTLVSFILAACAGVTGDITVAIPPHITSHAASALASVPPTRIEVREISGRSPLPGPIGERRTVGIPGTGTILGTIPLGLVTVSPPVDRLLTDMLRAELVAAGHRLTNSEAKVAISGEVRVFKLYTGATLLYWDVVVEAALAITATAPALSVTRNYTAISTERTYVCLCEEILARVVRACIEDLARQFRDDRQVAAVLSAR